MRQKRLHYKPLRIGRVAFIPQAIAPIMSTSDFSPDHRALPRIFANPTESQLPEITQLLFQSGSERFIGKSSKQRVGSRPPLHCREADAPDKCSRALARKDC